MKFNKVQMNYILLILSVFCLSYSEGQVRRCFSCRSRGVLGDCRDPFLFNETSLVPGVKTVPCASGWCSKTIDGDEFGEDHALATDRECLQSAPEDQVPRCTKAMFGHKRIFICFCKGSLCNSSHRTQSNMFGLLIVLAVYLLRRWGLFL